MLFPLLNWEGFINKEVNNMKQKRHSVGTVSKSNHKSLKETKTDDTVTYMTTHFPYLIQVLKKIEKKERKRKKGG